MRASDLPLNYNAVDILERNLPARWDKVALYSDSRDMTFRAVAAEANRVGNALRALDVRYGENVALLALDTPEWVTAFFGTLKVGAVAASFSTLLTAHEYGYMLADCRARVLVVSEPILPKILEVRSQVPTLEHIIVIGNAADDTVAFDDWVASSSEQLDAVATHRDDFCCLNYSSGTTGEPKGIFHAHKDLPLTAQLWGVNVLGLTEHDRTFAAAKLFFTFGTGGNLVFPWYAGASVVLFAGPPRIPTNVLGVIQKYQPTILFNAPTGYASLLAVEGFPEKFDISSLRLGVSAGESLPAPIWDAWKRATGLDLIDGIGSTENYHIFISNRPGDIRPGSSGKPIPGYDLRIIDEDGADVAPGDVGSLLVKGETAALSYLHQYDKSRTTFLGEWLNTGDKYFVDDDGYYWHAGRSDDMLKVGGIWVSPTEVESTLLAHPAVQECAVVGHPDRAGLIKPKAYVVCKDGHVPTDDLADGLIEYCRTQMAEYKRPRWVEFIDELPKTATGKIQRYRLRS